nr:MAG TPA: hypothetical protein [Caudoviricetes sp.]
MCVHWSMNCKTCALCGEPIPDALKARASEITTGKLMAKFSALSHCL